MGILLLMSCLCIFMAGKDAGIFAGMVLADGRKEDYVILDLRSGERALYYPERQNFKYLAETLAWHLGCGRDVHFEGGVDGYAEFEPDEVEEIRGKMKELG